MDTFLAIMQLIIALDQKQVDAVCGDGGALSDKQALTMSKYIFKAFELISDSDQAKRQPVTASV